MSAKPKRIIIEGIKEDGNKFRPSNGCERLANFGDDQRLQYCKSAQPYAFFIHCADENKLKVQEDRRQQRQEIGIDRRVARRILNNNHLTA